MFNVDEMEELIIDCLGTDGALEAILRAMSVKEKKDILGYIIRCYELDYEEAI